MDYQKYIASSEWRHKRQLRLKIDQYKCRTCGETENLECHHVTYERLGNEDIADLITLCKDCHKAITNTIRDRRYKNANKNYFKPIQQDKDINYVEASRSEIDWDSTSNPTQRTISRPVESRRESLEENFWEAF